VSYEFLYDAQYIDKASVNFKYSRIAFDYKDFRDLTSSATAGTEPFYAFTANVIQLYFSAWY